MPTKTKRLKDILDKEDITVHDAGELLRHAGDLLQQIPQARIRSARDAKKDADRLVNDAIGVLDSLDGYYDRLEAEEGKLLDRLDDLYKRVTKRRLEVQKKLKADLAEAPSTYDIDKVDKLIDLVERLETLDAARCERVMRVAAALAGEDD